MTFSQKPRWIDTWTCILRQSKHCAESGKNFLRSSRRRIQSSWYSPSSQTRTSGCQMRSGRGKNVQISSCRGRGGKAPTVHTFPQVSFSKKLGDHGCFLWRLDKLPRHSEWAVFARTGTHRDAHSGRKRSRSYGARADGSGSPHPYLLGPRFVADQTPNISRTAPVRHLTTAVRVIAWCKRTIVFIPSIETVNFGVIHTPISPFIIVLLAVLFVHVCLLEGRSHNFTVIFLKIRFSSDLPSSRQISPSPQPPPRLASHHVEDVVVWIVLSSHPQPTHRSGHGCTVGVDGDPPV